MEKRTMFTGTLNGVFGVFCDVKPKGLKNAESKTFYIPDEGKAFYKDGEYYYTVIVDEEHKIEDYTEIVLPKSDEEKTFDNK